MNTIVYEPRAGQHISEACIDAVNLAKAKAAHVRFAFNGLTVDVHAKSKPAEVVSMYNKSLAMLAERDAASVGGQAAIKRRSEQVAARQSQVASLMDSLPYVLKANHLNEVIHWLRLFTLAADDTGVKKDVSHVAAALQAAGYVRNEHVGQPPSWFSTRKRMGRYIVGQAIDCMLDGMPPHPVGLSFIDRYEKLPQE